MVHVNNTSGGSLTLDADDRVHNTSWYKSDSIDMNTLKLKVYDTENNTAQESIIRLNNDATIDYDNQYDCYFLPGYAPQFYSVMEDGSKLSTNTFPDLSDNSEIYFDFIKNNSSKYYLKADGVNDFGKGIDVYLTDLKTNYTQKLNDNPEYHFTAEEGDAAKRFKLHFGVLGTEDINAVPKLNIYSYHGEINISGEKAMTGTVNVYNITGQLVLTKRINNEKEVKLDAGNLKGLAIVSVVTSGNTYNQKVLVK
jgi:hypothetical protein